MHIITISVLLLPFFLLLSLPLSSAQDQLPTPLFSFSGDWHYAQRMYVPTWLPDGTCKLASSSSSYATFNYTFQGDGVRRFSSFHFDYVIVYEGRFNPDNPCQGTAMLLVNDHSDGAYDYDAYTWYKGGVSYTFVVIDGYTFGSFTGQITEGWQSATSNTMSRVKNPIYINATTNTCVVEDQGAYKPYYSKVSFTARVTGYYDVEAYFAHVADNAYDVITYLSVYKGNPDLNVESDGCSNVGYGVQLVAAVYHKYLYAEIVSLHLVNGVSYTAVVSRYNNDSWGPFGVRVSPTRRFYFILPTTTNGKTVGGFTEPPRDYEHFGVPGSDCTTNSDGYDNRPYAATIFDIPSNYIFDLYTVEPYRYVFFLYTGENFSPPYACTSSGRYLNWRSSGSMRTYGPYTETDFTIVATPQSSSTVANESYYTDVYVVSGAPITPTNTPTRPPMFTTSSYTTSSTASACYTNALLVLIVGLAMLM